MLLEADRKNLLKEHIKSVPPRVLDEILAPQFKTRLQEITKRQRLLINQAGSLETETILVMAGLEPLANFVENLERELGIPQERAREIALDVSENVFKPIREDLRNMNEDDKDLIRQQKILDQEPETVYPNTNNVTEEITSTKQVTEENKESNTLTLETLSEIPYQQDIKTSPTKAEAPKLPSFETKLAGITITPQQILENKVENKLPPVIQKQRPSSGVDPYREPIQ